MAEKEKKEKKEKKQAAVQEQAPEQTPETEQAAVQPEQGPGPEAELAAVKEELEKAAKELAEAKDTLLRTAAEYDNFRKRSAKEKDAAFGNGVSFAVEKLLSVLDTLTLAAQAQTTDESYKKGVVMTLEKASAAFAAMGVEEIEAQDKPFDPELHAAVMQQEAPEGVESGTVIQVLQKGYTYNGKVIRHAAVAVAQ